MLCGMIDNTTLNAKFFEIRPLLNERQLRLVALAEARSLGHGGIKVVAEASNPVEMLSPLTAMTTFDLALSFLSVFSKDLGDVPVGNAMESARR